MNNNYDNTQYVLADEGGLHRYIAKVFGWMFVGLLVIALTAYAVVIGITTSPAFAQTIASIMPGIFVLILLQVVLVGYITTRIQKLQTSTAKLLYLVYAISNGFAFGIIALAYYGSADILVTAFGITAVSFGVMSIYGLTTKQDLTRVGNLFFMALLGLIVVSIVNIFLRNNMMEFIICIVGLAIFLGLTAYHTSQIKNYYYQTAATGDVHLANNLAIIGALSLYLSFINIFMFILRLIGLGGRR